MISDFVRVQVTARQRVCYSQIIPFTREDWAEFKEMNERDAADALSDRLNLLDVADGDRIEDIEAFVVDEVGKPVAPEDSYGGEAS